ncbi:hypothetical protein [Helicobacter sp.]|uniref:hypothetical protein n=1 Tax=Helicobacter sp. TaxID=218 RepID=UPI0025BA0E84|nr:hypothetical protein [Helicobacter sp.]MCI5968286.1 hypothetical protein [Helicobacter sp.]MDY2585378.1 hypothetical protein [Helicobacter sp.]
MEFKGYIKDTQKEVSFIIKDNALLPKEAQDAEALQEAWEFDSDGFLEFMESLNDAVSDPKEKLEILINPQDYVFLYASDIYDRVYYGLGPDISQEEVEAELDRVYCEEVICQFE